MADSMDIINPNTNLQIPAWVNAEYFKDILAKDELNYASISKFTPTAAVPPGENFASGHATHPYGIKNEGTKAKSYILKTSLEADKGGKEMDEYGLFPREYHMYSKYLPAFEGLYKAAGKNLKLAPKCLFTEQKNGQINFIFEDLTSQHFVKYNFVEYKKCCLRKCCLRTLDTAANSFNVLTHGDCWSGNFMFNYLKAGSINEVLLIDFQVCKWGSPAEDLLFFISISAAKDIRLAEFEHFVEIYYEHLIECLQLLHYKKPLPKLRELQMAMFSETTTFYAFFAVFNHLFVILLPRVNDSNMEMLLRRDKVGHQFRLRALNGPIFVEAMKDLFPFYHRRGLFNFSDYY